MDRKRKLQVRPPWDPLFVVGINQTPPGWVRMEDIRQYLLSPGQFEKGLLWLFGLRACGLRRGFGHRRWKVSWVSWGTSLSTTWLLLGWHPIFPEPHYLAGAFSFCRTAYSFIRVRENSRQFWEVVEVADSRGTVALHWFFWEFSFPGQIRAPSVL